MKIKINHKSYITNTQDEITNMENQEVTKQQNIMIQIIFNCMHL